MFLCRNYWSCSSFYLFNLQEHFSSILRLTWSLYEGSTEINDIFNTHENWLDIKIMLLNLIDDKNPNLNLNYSFYLSKQWGMTGRSLIVFFVGAKIRIQTSYPFKRNNKISSLMKTGVFTSGRLIPTLVCIFLSFELFVGAKFRIQKSYPCKRNIKCLLPDA